MTALVIVARELRERLRLFAVSAALAVLPFVSTLLPGGRHDPADVIGAVSGFLSMAMALGSAAAFGGSTITRDLAERRLSFYFSRPIAPSSLWIGKAVASLLSSLICFAIIAVPSALAIGGTSPVLWMMTTREIVSITVVGVVVLFFLFHVLSSIIRSRSALIAVDFVLAALLAGSVLALARPLLVGAAADLLKLLGIGLGVAILAILAIAPIWQLRNGRTDIRRSHAALSRFLWPAIYGVLAIVAAYVFWVIAAGPDDLSRVLVLDQSPRAEWVVAGGVMKSRGDYQAAFLIDGKKGRKRLGVLPWSEVRFARQAELAAWFEPAGVFGNEGLELHTSRGGTGIRVDGYAAFAVSDDGSRVAIAYRQLVAVYELASGKILASAGGFDRTLFHHVFFVSNDTVRVIELSYRATGGPFRIFEIDVPRRRVLKTADARLPVSASLTASNDGSRILLHRQRRLIDGRTATTLLDLPEVNTMSAAVLSDGRLVETYRDGSNFSRLRVFGGAEVRIPMAHASIAGELPEGKLLVRATRRIGWSGTGADRSQFVVDPDRGVIVATAPELKTGQVRWSHDPRLGRYEARRIAAVDRDGKLVWWDPQTGAITSAQ